jgi:hypothetical protein
LSVYADVDAALSPDFPLGVELEVFVRREDAERFIEEVRGDDSELAGSLCNRGARARHGNAMTDAVVRGTATPFVREAR